MRLEEGEQVRCALALYRYRLCNGHPPYDTIQIYIDILVSIQYQYNYCAE